MTDVVALIYAANPVPAVRGPYKKRDETLPAVSRALRTGNLVGSTQRREQLHVSCSPRLVDAHGDDDVSVILCENSQLDLDLGVLPHPLRSAPASCWLFFIGPSH
jgi:hypothetical protein